MSELTSVGVDVTQKLKEHMATYPITPHNRQRLALTPESERANAIWFIKYVSCAVEVAVEMQERYGRGFILCDETSPMRAFYVKRSEIEKALVDVPLEVIPEVKRMVDAYKRRYEGVMVNYRPKAVRPMHFIASGELLSPGDFIRPSWKAPDPITLPEGVFSARDKTEDGVLYIYHHRRLGDLGSVFVSGFGIQKRIRLTPNGQDEACRAMFEGIGAALQEQFKMLFGQAVLDKAMFKPSPETMRALESFVAADSSFELYQFQRDLSTEQIQEIVKTAEATARIVGAHDAQSIQQRLSALRQMRSQEVAFSPTTQWLYDFVQARSSEEAQALLRTQPDGELSEESWAQFWTDDPAIQAHIQSRKVLLGQ